MSTSDFGALVERAAPMRYVLLGAASHGTHEFFRERAGITKRLILDAGFTGVAVEASRADAQRVDRYVRGEGDDASAEQALGDFRRFPSWMWRNPVVLDFVAWLRGFNDALPAAAPKVGFHGIDLLRAVRGSDAWAWTIRDRQMADALEAVTARDPEGRRAKAVVWAHNLHVGDAGATELGRAGRRSLGQLMRGRAGAETLLVGFTTYTGTVTAAREWGGPAERREVRPGAVGSYEELFHRRDLRRFVVEPTGLPGQLAERAIGVVYRPEEERLRHYFQARIGNEFDAVVHLDETRAVEPLEPTSEWDRDRLPPTYPWGL
jgi:erythromycin esterase-like protein